MQKLLFSLLFVACCLYGSMPRALAQGPAANRGFATQPAGSNAGFDPGAPTRAPAPVSAPSQATRMTGPVAVIDLLYIFENHPGFQQKKLNMDREKEGAEKDLLGRRDALKEHANQLKEFKPGTSQYSDLESKLAQEEAALQVDLKKANQEFIVREGKMYWETYQEVLEIVKWYANQRGIAMVLRFTGGGKVNADNPEEVMKEMNEQVVYFNDGINITGDILQQIKNKYGNLPQRVGRAPGGPQQPPQQRLR